MYQTKKLAKSGINISGTLPPLTFQHIQHDILSVKEIKMQAQWHKTNRINVVPSRTEVTRTHQNPHAKAGLSKSYAIYSRLKSTASRHSKYIHSALDLHDFPLLHRVLNSLIQIIQHNRGSVGSLLFKRRSSVSQFFYLHRIYVMP